MIAKPWVNTSYDSQLSCISFILSFPRPFQSILNWIHLYICAYTLILTFVILLKMSQKKENRTIKSFIFMSLPDGKFEDNLIQLTLQTLWSSISEKLMNINKASEDLLKKRVGEGHCNIVKIEFNLKK